ncbi:MAG: hypothetical protein V3V64_01700 [Acidiferrobacterales bacterium]
MSTPVRAAQAPVPPCLGRDYAPGNRVVYRGREPSIPFYIRAPPISVIPGDELVISAAHLHCEAVGHATLFGYRQQAGAQARCQELASDPGAENFNFSIFPT